MSRLDTLLTRFAAHLNLPWQPSAPRVWIVVYDRADERRLCARLDAFEAAARGRGLHWSAVDATALVPAWLGAHEYAEAYFESPELLDAEFGDLQPLAESAVRSAVDAAAAHGPQGVVALTGTGSLYGFVSVSDLIRSVEQTVAGRLVVFFPGSVEKGRYRLLDGHDGWDYRALAITADS